MELIGQAKGDDRPIKITGEGIAIKLNLKWEALP